ncbi:ABC transporter substrate-binding protein [Streptomyces sp. SBT349]|uniref:ABC transporter substrate-binding protein n=1 Tax=Streptomyces sp. SBT349 TaxID=1580539 RepID=UPI00066C960E|nr:extracellular solute-binding protein [Streptomyces sp. SBT349]
MRRATSKARTARRRTAALLTAALCAGALGGCSLFSPSGDGRDGEVTVWTPHSTPPRIAAQEAIAADFEEETGIHVNVVGMAAADMNQAIVAGAASGDLPDVALVGPDQVARWTAQGLVDTGAAREALNALGEDTLSERALDLVSIDGEPAAVPSDGWGEMLFYRTDVFDALGLSPPTSVRDMVEAAETIDGSDLGMAGIVLGTQPANASAGENLEHLALADGCAMFEGEEVALDSAACEHTFGEYQALTGASVAGDQNIESTRASYLAGDAAMVLWSPHLLDEIANLDPAFPVSCDQCAEDPGFLAANTGVVGAMTGENNDTPTGFGLTMNHAVLQGADREAALRYVDYVMNEGYADTLAMTPEGRVPVRSGPPGEPGRFIEEWRSLPLGADPENRRPFDEAFAPEVIEEVYEAANAFSRWGFGTENWATAGAAYTQNTLVTDVNRLVGGGDPGDYADRVAAELRTIQRENQ